VAITKADVSGGIRELNLSHAPLCVHSSLRSFGFVQGGALAIVQGIPEEGCTLMVPSFTSLGVPPPPGRTLQHNGSRESYLSDLNRRAHATPTFDATSALIDPDMGRIPKCVVSRTGRKRGNHPLNSFSAVGALADELIQGQQPLDVYAPLRTLAELNGFVILMGVDLTSLTLIHFAECLAGRNAFRRWARGESGRVIECEAGGCSDGFEKLAPFVADLARAISVGSSTWTVLPARPTVHRLSGVIRENPMVTHCGNDHCDRCNDAVLGGPILA